jgi:hypothetical protein
MQAIVVKGRSANGLQQKINEALQEVGDLLEQTMVTMNLLWL